MFSKSIENISYVTLMVFQSVTENKDIIYVHMYIFSNDILEYKSHYSLKSSRSIAVSLYHNIADECSINVNKGGFPNIRWFISNLFEGITHIEFQPVLSSGNI